MDDYGSFQTFMTQIWALWDTTINIPMIGSTSFLRITIFLALLSYLASFISGMFGGKNQ